MSDVKYVFVGFFKKQFTQLLPVKAAFLMRFPRLKLWFFFKEKYGQILKPLKKAAVKNKSTIYLSSDSKRGKTTFRF